MNTLTLQKKTQIISLLVEGNSLRAITRITGVSKNTVTKLLVEIGKACQQFHNDKVVGVKSERLQCDEIWSFVGCKEKTKVSGGMGDGDVWTWTALDADSKLIVSWLVGSKDADAACTFMYDVKDRLANRVQLTTDGHRAYLVAVERAFEYEVDYAM